MEYDELILTGNMLNFEQLKQKCLENPPRHPQFKNLIPHIEDCDDIEEMRKMALSWCWSVYHQEDARREMYSTIKYMETGICDGDGEFLRIMINTINRSILSKCHNHQVGLS